MTSCPPPPRPPRRAIRYYAKPFHATLHRLCVRCTIRCTIRHYAKPFHATLHCLYVCCAIRHYAEPFHATLHCLFVCCAIRYFGEPFHATLHRMRVHCGTIRHYTEPFHATLHRLCSVLQMSAKLKYIKVHTATRWTTRHGLMLLWFTDLMKVTEEVIIHRPNVSTLLSSTFIRGDLNAAQEVLLYDH